MRKHCNHIIFLLLACLSFAACRTKRRLPDLRETYSYKDNKPFDASVAYSMLKEAYPHQYPELIEKEFADNYQWDYDTSSLYVNISRNFFLSDRDAESLLDFVYKGNTVFISAENIDSNLLSKVHAKTAKDLSVLIYREDPLRYTSTGLTKKLSVYKESFQYFYYPFTNYFTDIKGLHAQPAGVNQDGSTNLCAFFWGKGRIFLHCEPRALSNYFLLSDNNYLYMEEIIRLLPGMPENVYWDDLHRMQNYRSRGDGSFSTFDTIMKYPALARAFFIALGLLLLYIFFNSKRRQRIIPVIKPAENNSVAFTEAIAGLYLGKKDNKLISEKMITYFNEHVRSKYFMQMNIQEQGYADMLSRKSGVSTDITIPLAQAMRSVTASPRVSDQQLLLLNGLTEKFFKHKI